MTASPHRALQHSPRRTRHRWCRFLFLAVLPAALVTCVSEERLAPRPFLQPGATATELLQNPDFEAGSAGWQNDDSTGRAIDAARVHGGLLALRIQASGLTDYAVYQDVAVTTGAIYAAAGWLASDSLAGPGGNIELLWLDTLGLTDSIPPSHLLGTESVGVLSGNEDWTLFSASFMAPSGAIGARFQLRVAMEPGDTGGASFDDLSLTLQPSPPPPDITPPSVVITAPLAGDTVQQVVTLQADATDDGMVAGVRFQVDGIAIGQEITQLPYSLDYNTDTLLNGDHLIAAVARDTAGNMATAAAVVVTVQNPPPRDVLVILTDDQRFDQMRHMPLTSALLTAETVRFKRGFVTTSLCCPSRASLLTGLYVHNHGVKFVAAPEGGAIAFDPTSTLATWLKGAGYRTAMIGKYLNAYDVISPAIPPGWDIFEALVTGQLFYSYSLNQNGTVISYGTAPADYGTDVLAQRASQFILSTPARQPLLLYFAPSAPHEPATPHPQDVGSFATYPNWRPASFNEADVRDKPSWIRNRPKLTSAKIASDDALHRAMLESLQAVDRAVAGIIGTLQQTGRWSNTLVIYSSDNGLSWGEHRLREKLCAYEECIRVPFWVRMPGVAARQESKLVANIDLAPTIAAWAGVTPPAKVNGLNLLPLMQNPTTPWRTGLLVEHWGEILIRTTPATTSSGVRTDRWLYNEYLNGEKELYDLKTDPLELTNVVTKSANAALVASLKAKLGALKLE